MIKAELVGSLLSLPTSSHLKYSVFIQVLIMPCTVTFMYDRENKCMGQFLGRVLKSKFHPLISTKDLVLVVTG